MYRTTKHVVQDLHYMEIEKEQAEAASNTIGVATLWSNSLCRNMTKDTL